MEKLINVIGFSHINRDVLMYIYVQIMLANLNSTYILITHTHVILFVKLTFHYKKKNIYRKQKLTKLVRLRMFWVITTFRFSFLPITQIRLL